jgi:hypothetical protein
VDFTKSVILIATILIATLNWLGVRNRDSLCAKAS